MIKETEKIVTRVLSQAKYGYVCIGGWTYYVDIGTNGGDIGCLENNRLTLNIPDFDEFVRWVDKYLKVAIPIYENEKEYFELNDLQYKERLFFNLLLNITHYESLNVDDTLYKYIDERIIMTQNRVSTGKFLIGDIEYLKNNTPKRARVFGKIKENMSNLEAPYRMSFVIDGEDGEKLCLPSVTFGLAGKKAYVYAVQHDKTDKVVGDGKTIDRYIRKVNKGIDVEDVISQVSPSSLVAFTLFVKQMQKRGVKQIVAKDFLPLRYWGAHDSPASINQERLDRIDRDQFNMTNKFMYLFLRYYHHFDNCDVEYNSMTGERTMKIAESRAKDDNIIYDFDALGENQDILEIY